MEKLEMAEIIETIVAVKFWQMKMLNEDYIKIWKKEIKKKYNISERMVNAALALLYDRHFSKDNRIGGDSSIW